MNRPDRNALDTSPSPPLRVSTVSSGLDARKWLAIGLIAAAVPLLVLVYLLHRYAVDIPVWDDWEMAPLIAHARTGQPFLFDIFQQQQEARTVIPKSLILLLAGVGHWHLTYLMALSVIFSAATLAGIYFLLRQSALGPRAMAACLFLTSLFLFSPTYYEVWLTGSDFSSFLPALWLVAALALVGTNVSIARKFLGCAILSVGASFSLAHGLLLWGITFPLALLIDGVPRWRRWLLLWLGACALCVAVYFWDYHKPKGLPHFAPAISPIDYLKYVFIFLGSALARAGEKAPVLPAAIFGASGLVIFATALYYAFTQRKNRAFLRRTLPWFALGSYAIGSAGLAAFGRVAYGTTQALQSRYGAFALYLFVALIGLAAIIYRDATSERRRVSNPARISVMALLTLALLIPFAFCAVAGVAAMRAGSANNRLGRSAVLFSRAFDTGSTIKKTIYPLPATVRRQARLLDDLDLILPALIKTNNISSIRHSPADGRNASGWCESIASNGEGMLVATGWAVLNSAGRSADGVVLAYKYPDRDWVFFAMSSGISGRSDIAVRMKSQDQFWSGWEATFPRTALPRDAEFSAWAIDSKQVAIYRLDSHVPAEKSAPIPPPAP